MTPAAPILDPIRTAPREVQQVAFEKGLIPYIPADRPAGDGGHVVD